MTHDTTTALSHLVNLADAALGARALACSDDFFASMHNLLEPTPPQFDPNAYTERGKLMDGWESRRKRTEGHDWCLLRMGATGRPHLVDIDTSHFLGNHPPFASLQATHAPADATPETLEAVTWTEVLPQVPLRPGSHNLFPIRVDGTYTHLRLRIYPDGGVARLRVWGDVEPGWQQPEIDEESRPYVQKGETDLAALLGGGLALACSDSFFGPMNNLLLPGRAANMGGGWETRRRRGPGFDWIVVRLGRLAHVGAIEIDTNHFKGNYPDRASLEGILAPDAPLTELVDPQTAWSSVLPSTRLQAHTRHFFRSEIEQRGPFSHVRLRIDPDGGVSRLRVWARPHQEGA